MEKDSRGENSRRTLGGMKKPPPLPEAVLTRVLAVARFNGWSVLICALLFALLSLAFGDLIGLTVCAFIAYGGWTEVAGRKQILRGNAEGVNKLIRAQWIVLGVIAVYCARQLVSFDTELMIQQVPPEMQSALTEAGYDLRLLAPLVKQVFYSVYVSVALLTALYQGGLARYYAHRRSAIATALADRARAAVAPPPKPAGEARHAPEDFLT